MRTIILFLFLLPLPLMGQIIEINPEDDGVTVLGATAAAEEEILLFEMGDISGNTIYDTSGNNNDASIYVRTTDFRGGYLNYGAAAILTGAMTISFWAKGEGVSPTLGGGVSRCGNSTNRGYNFGIRNAGILQFYIASNNTTLATAVTGTLTAGDSSIWVHYMGTYSPSAYIRVFRNGVQLGQLTTSVPASQYSASNALVIGAWGDGDNNYYGSMADVRIYDTVKTYDEIMAFDTNDIVFWDMMSYFYKDTSMALTGQQGAKKEGIIQAQYQNAVRYPVSVNKVSYQNCVAYVPYDINGNSQYATFDPIFNSTETQSARTYTSNQLFDNGDKYKFATDDSLYIADRYEVYYTADSLSKLIEFRWLSSGLGDYFVSTLTGNDITDFQIYYSDTEVDSIDSYINWGQSNAVGQIPFTTIEDSLEGNLHAYVYTLNGVDTLNGTVDKNNQFGQKKSLYGYELTLAERLYDLTGEYTAWMKYAIGGTALHELAEWSAATNHYRNYYDSLTLCYNDFAYYMAKTLSKKVTLKGIVQYQGESDATVEGEANAYDDNLQLFYNGLATSFPELDYNIYIVKPGSNHASFPYIANVRTSIDNFNTNNDNVYIINGELYGFGPDAIHHSEGGYNAVGIAIADTIFNNE